jgi:hypothetical protein
MGITMAGKPPKKTKKKREPYRVKDFQKSRFFEGPRPLGNGFAQSH